MSKKHLRFVMATLVLLFAAIGLVTFVSSNRVKEFLYVAWSKLIQENASKGGHAMVRSGLIDYQGKNLRFFRLKPARQGHWYVGPAGTPGVDSENLELVLMSSSPGDVIHLSNGRYLLHNLSLTAPLSFEGEEKEKTEILLASSCHLRSNGNSDATLSFKNLTLREQSEKDLPHLFFQEGGKLELEEVLVFSQNSVAQFHLSGDSRTTATSSRFLAGNRGEGFLLSDQAQLEVNYSNFVSSKHGIATALEGFIGRIKISETLFKNSHSSALSLWGGQIVISRASFEGGMGGVVAKRSAQIEIDTVDFSGQELHALDVFDQARVSVQNSQIENGRESGVRVFKFSGELKILSSSINANTTGLLAQESRGITLAGVEMKGNTKEGLNLQDSSLHCLGLKISGSPVGVSQKNSTIKSDNCQGL
jgi:hypothetical protein